MPDKQYNLIAMYGLLFLPLGYLLGSIPFAYLVARARKVDILQIGTNNPGAANVFRKIGRAEGVAVLIGDVSKSALPVLLARWAGVSPWLALAVGIATMVGHWYPVFNRFRGGAGLATAIGVAYAMMPLPSLLATIPGLFILYARRNVGHATALAFIAFFIVAFILGESGPLTAAILVLPGLALARHLLLPTPGVEPGEMDPSERL